MGNLGYQDVVIYEKPIKRTHHVHIYQFDNTQEILRHLAFRNYLRENPAIATTYGTLKSNWPKHTPIALINIWMAKMRSLRK